MWWWDIPELLLWVIGIVAALLALGFIVVMATVYEAAVLAIEYFNRAKETRDRHM